MMNTVQGNVNAQRMGMVSVFWAIDGSQFNDLKQRLWAHKRMEGTLPVRLGACHCCLPESSEHFAKLLTTMYLRGIGPEIRQRVRFHTGKI